MKHQSTALSFAVRGRIVIKYFGQLCLVVAILTTVPLLVSLVLRDFAITLRYAMALALLAACGGIFARLRAPTHIQKNEAMVIVCLIFVATPLLMTLPMTASGLGFLDALFETVSAATTTGLSTTASVSDKPATFLFARAWMQWYGGLGIVILSVAFILQPGVVTRRMAVTESQEDGLVGGMRAYARRVLLIYLILTVGGVVALLLAGTEAFHALLFTLTAVSTGGFAPVDDSLARLPVLGQGLVTLLCLAGSTSFVFYLRFSRKGLGELYRDLQLRSVVAMGLTATVGLALILALGDGRNWTESLRHGALMSFSAQTTAGFGTTPVSDMNPGAKLLLIFCMSVGGGAGSTAGGFKISRLLILARLLQVILARTCLPDHAVLEPRLGRSRIESSEVEGALTLILAFIGIVLLSWLPFLLMGYDPLDSLFEVVSATGTVGLSSGVTAPDLPAPLKSVLCVDMVLGRLEIIPVLVLLYPRTWLGRRRTSA